MSLKSRSIIKKAGKLAILSLIILIIINLWFNFNILNAKQENKKVPIKQDINNYNYINIKIKPLASVAIAISTNIWIQYLSNNNQNKTSYLYNNLFSVKQVLNNSKQIKENILWKNMLFLKDYFNFIKTDFNKNINNSQNRKIALNSILNQLEYRYNQANKNANFLLNQKKIIQDQYNKIEDSITQLKNKIKFNYTNNNLEELYSNMDDYYNLKQKETILKTYILYINNFLKKYLILNKYNKILINTLKINKNIIIKNSYLVIPDSWKAILKEYKLLITQEEYNKQKEQ